MLAIPELADSDTAGSTPAEVATDAPWFEVDPRADPAVEDDFVEPDALDLDVPEVACDEPPAVVPFLAVVAVTPEAGVVAAPPVAVPPLAEGGGAVTVTTPQVGVVCPAWTSAGVRSPHEYADDSACVGETAPGTFLRTALMPYCSRESPRLA